MRKHAQSILEYVLMLTLVILGIYFMGPYVLRSINAHFKLWDEGVQDSYSENLNQAPQSAVPNIPLNCSCHPTQNCSTGGTGALCPVGDMEMDYNCSPALCNGAGTSYSCTPNASCCGNWAPLGCGDFPCPAGGCPTVPMTSAMGTNNCYYGYQLQGMLCGAAAYTFQCVYDPQPSGPCPLPTCLGPDIGNATGCPGSIGTDGNPPLTQENEGKTYWTTCPSPPSPCQYTCDAGYQLQDGACVQIQCNQGSFVVMNGNHQNCLEGCCGGGDCANIADAKTGSTEAAINAAFICQENGFNYVVSCQGHGPAGCAGCVWVQMATPGNIQGNLQGLTFTKINSSSGQDHIGGMNVTCSTCPAGWNGTCSEP